jgi:hypothetical protein
MKILSVSFFAFQTFENIGWEVIGVLMFATFLPASTIMAFTGVHVLWGISQFFVLISAEAIQWKLSRHAKFRVLPAVITYVICNFVFFLAASCYFASHSN